MGGNRRSRGRFVKEGERLSLTEGEESLGGGMECHSGERGLWELSGPPD